MNFFSKTLLDYNQMQNAHRNIKPEISIFDVEEAIVEVIQILTEKSRARSIHVECQVDYKEER